MYGVCLIEHESVRRISNISGVYVTDRAPDGRKTSLGMEDGLDYYS